jgi:hypothetical protein
MAAAASELRSIFPVGASLPALEVNMRLAEEINRYVNQKIAIIINYLERCKIDYEKEGVTPELFSSMISMAFEATFTPCAEDYRVLLDPSPLDAKLQAIQRISQTAQKAIERLGIGTCMEMSAVGLEYCMLQNVAQKVEVFCIEGGNHVFLVIDRDPQSRPEDYSSWGPRAVVCDPWVKTAYPASEIAQRLKSFDRQTFAQDGTPRTILTDFTPSKHQLTILVGSP